MSNTDFIKKIAPDAQKMYKNYKILASLIIAQGCLESAYGNSGLAVDGKNLFGMKGEYNGQYVIMKTWEFIDGRNVQVDAKFRKYPSWSESIQDLANLYLKGTSWDPNHYKAVVGETNYKKATAALVSAGYATDPSYATKLNNIIETYSLTKYDTLVSEPTTTPTPAPLPSVVVPEEVEINVDAYSNDIKVDPSANVPITDGNFRIQYKNGTVIDMARNLSVLVRSFRISSPDPEIEYETIQGRNGSLRMGKTYGNRTITADCVFFGTDNTDYHLLQAELFHALFKDDEYFLISEATPKKRWRVELSSSFTPDRMGSTGEFTLTFVSASTYCESVATTLSAFTFDSDMWQLGEGLTEETFKYKHSTNTFKIYNAGTVRIDPLELPLNISYKGASNKLEIYNKTTGDKWTYSGTSSASDTIKLTGVLARKGSTSIFGSTNHGLITLAPGWNEFVLDGTSSKFEITFDFRFYYFA